jgi:hypothetical protein
MRFIPADPDLATIYNRISDGEIDLQPDFQRGEVWTVVKQQRLIDSIIRGWVVPPILVIDNQDGGQLQVLDGQQRLAAIRDFRLDRFSIDGYIEPMNEDFARLHDLKYSMLPIETKRMFDRTTIRFFHVTDFQPEEPAEIFFRLNQPTALSSAEKRNAFFGPVRQQIRAAVNVLFTTKIVERIFGYSNSRMAYDDLLARFVFTVEIQSLTKKVTAASIDLMYRRKEPIVPSVEKRFLYVLEFASSVFNHFLETEKFVPKLNKAATLSWLIFFARSTSTVESNAKFFEYFEGLRNGYRTSISEREFGDFDGYLQDQLILKLLQIYDDRVTARVADVSSVLIRDFVLWLVWVNHTQDENAPFFTQQFDVVLQDLASLKEFSVGELEELLLEKITNFGWGVSF